MNGNSKQGNAFTNNPIVKAIGTQKIVVVLAVIALAVFFSAMSPAFRQYSTLVSILDYSYYISFMAIGVTFCLISGGVDLSIGTGMICYGLIGGYLVQMIGLPVWVGLIATILSGMVIGLINGLMVSLMNLPPFIATLCTMLFTRGIGSIVTKGMAVSWPASGSAGGWFRTLFKVKTGSKAFPMLPVGFLIVIVCIIIMSIVLNKSKIGRYIIAIGSNKEAARLSGVNVVKYQISAYVISGFFAGLAGISYAAIFKSSIAPGTGAGLEMDAIGGAIIGGTSRNGGVGSITGTLLGVFVMSLLKTGLPFIGLQANWQQIITGLVLIFAIWLDVIKNKKTA